MQTDGTGQRSTTREILDSPLVLMTALMFGITLWVLLWQDFVRVLRWIGL